MFMHCCLSAWAVGFSADELPKVLSFDYEWQVPSASGTTSFSFAPGTLRTETLACSSSDACLDGRFQTGNGGEGSYSTDLRVRDCVLRFADFVIEGALIVVPARCEVDQHLLLFYDQTSATYTGTATWGSMEFERTFDCTSDPTCPLEADRSPVYRRAPGRFQGQLAGPGTGVFHES